MTKKPAAPVSTISEPNAHPVWWVITRIRLDGAWYDGYAAVASAHPKAGIAIRRRLWIEARDKAMTTLHVGPNDLILEELVKDDVLPKFDADLSPQHQDNKRAAEARGLRYDQRRRRYVDEDGCPILDKFGQPLG